MTFVALVDFPVESARDESLAVLVPAPDATRAFAGNTGVEVLLDGADHVLVLEHWDRAEDYAAYQAWRATPEGEIAGLSPLISGPVTTRGHTVAS